MKAKLPIAAILLSGVLWGAIGLFVRPLSQDGYSSMQLVALRALITAGVLFIFLLLSNRRRLRVRLRHLWCFLGTGLCSIVFFNFCYFNAIETATMSVASVLLYTAPCFVMLLSLLLFRERVTPRKVAALLLSLLGLCLVTGLIGGGAQRVSLQGILYGLGAGLGYALYSIFGRFALQRGYHPLTVTFYTFVCAAIGALALCGPAGLAATFVQHPQHLGLLLLFGVVTSVLPYAAYTWGLTGVESSKASIMASVEPVVATLLGTLCFHEKLSAAGLLGVAMVLGAVLLLNLAARAPNAVSKAEEKPELCVKR